MVLALQRSIGNAAVASMLASKRPGTSIAARPVARTMRLISDASPSEHAARVSVQRRAAQPRAAPARAALAHAAHGGRVRPAGHAAANGRAGPVGRARGEAHGGRAGRAARKGDAGKRKRRARRAATLAQLVAALLGSPKPRDFLRVARLLGRQSIATIVSVARRLAVNRTVVQTLEGVVAGTRGFVKARVLLPLAAARLRGQQSRLGFQTQQLALIGAFKARESRQALERVLRIVGEKVKTLRSMKSCVGYKQLFPHEKLRLDYMIAGSTSIPQKARPAMAWRLKHLATDKVEMFRDFVASKFFINDADVDQHTTLADGQQLPRETATRADAGSVPAHTYFGPAFGTPAHRWNVTVGADSTPIPVYEPPGGVSSDRTPLTTVDEVQIGLAETPRAARDRIKRVDLNPIRPQGSTGFMQTVGTSGEVTVFPTEPPQGQLLTSAGLAHEAGHTASYQQYTYELSSAGWTGWRAAMASDAPMVISKYAQTNEQEDFAESWSLWVPTAGQPREDEIKALIPNRVTEMQKVAATPAPPR
jgi:hypothetical protein